MSYKQDVKIGQHGYVFEKEVTKVVRYPYLLFLPQGYGEIPKEWPMIFFLHGAGERGDDVELVKKHGPPKIVEESLDFPFVVLSPQCPEEKWWSPDSLIVLLDEIVSKYAIDEERIYLTGLSMGGFGTWSLACEYPERFAAAVPICGGGIPYRTRNMVNIPTWVFHGAKDAVVPLEESEDMVKALTKYGGDVRLTVYPEAGHDSWTETYNNPDLYQWFLSHRRQDPEQQG